TEKIADYIADVARTGTIPIGRQRVPFLRQRDIIFHLNVPVEHPNTLTFKAFLADGKEVAETFLSLGGGFISRQGVYPEAEEQICLPFPIDTGAELLAYCAANDCSIAEIVAQNELAFRPAEEITRDIHAIFNTMVACVQKGCSIPGILPGGLQVRRRAKAIHDQLLGDCLPMEIDSWLEAIRQQPHHFTNINKWVSCFALAVNEENAAMGRVVTSPTNGAAGVIPAVILYYLCFCEGAHKTALRTFFYTAGEIGCLFKKGATISAAMGGCQAEIGVSAAMAAGGLAAVLGGSPKQVLVAAEIAMEHHLGLTCDPAGGLVQIPCIERNAMGAMKAITAANLALVRDPDEALVNFDMIVNTMWETAKDMNGKYKETSEGGLAIHLPVVHPNC
ncbi:MAG: L-serine ammonia-lyase, partial [Bacteroidetes bacterium]